MTYTDGYTVAITTGATDIGDARDILDGLCQRAGVRPEHRQDETWTMLAGGVWRATFRIGWSDGYGGHHVTRIMREAERCTYRGHVYDPADLEDEPCLCGAARSEHYAPRPAGYPVMLSQVGRDCVVTS